MMDHALDVSLRRVLSVSVESIPVEYPPGRSSRFAGVTMQASLNRLLIAIAVLIVTMDAVWLQLGHFTIDSHPYLLLVLIVPLCAAGASYYGRVRNEAGLSAMFSATAFLLIVPAASCLLSYLAVTIAGPRIDSVLAAFDQDLGVSWPAIMGFAADHPLLTQTLSLAYGSI